MQLSQPGPLWYSAVLIGVRAGTGTNVIGSFQVWDASQTRHNGLAIDGTTVQPLLDVEIDTANLPNIRLAVQTALQNLIIQEFGGVTGLITWAVQNEVSFS